MRLVRRGVVGLEEVLGVRVGAGVCIRVGGEG